MMHIFSNKKNLSLCAAVAVLFFAAYPAVSQPERQLRVCADPNNLPFSNAQQEGFENRIANILAEEMHATVQYTWWAQRRGFIRNTLKAGNCDVVMAVPKGFEQVSTTTPYYRSTYVFVYPKNRDYRIHSFDDPILHKLKIGVHLMGDDYANTPPAHALSRRNIIDNVAGFMIYGDYRQPNPPARIFDALTAGEIDVAIVWGPLAGFFAQRASIPLEIVPVSPRKDAFLPMEFDISVGVRRGDDSMKKEIEVALAKRRLDIQKVLAAYAVPQTQTQAQAETDMDGHQ